MMGTNDGRPGLRRGRFPRLMRNTILYNTMDTCRANGFLASSHVLEDNSDLPLLEPGGRFRKQSQYGHKCQIATIEVEANTKIRKSLIGRSRPMRGYCVPGDPVYYWRAGQGDQHRKAIGWDPQKSLVKAAICGFHTEQQRSNVRKNEFGWHHLPRKRCER